MLCRRHAAADDNLLRRSAYHTSDAMRDDSLIFSTLISTHYRPYWHNAEYLFLLPRHFYFIYIHFTINYTAFEFLTSSLAFWSPSPPPIFRIYRIAVRRSRRCYATTLLFMSFDTSTPRFIFPDDDGCVTRRITNAVIVE